MTNPLEKIEGWCKFEKFKNWSGDLILRINNESVLYETFKINV